MESMNNGVDCETYRRGCETPTETMRHREIMIEAVEVAVGEG